MKISKKVFAKYEVPRTKCPLTEKKNTKYYGDTLEKGFFLLLLKGKTDHINESNIQY